MSTTQELDLLERMNRQLRLVTPGLLGGRTEQAAPTPARPRRSDDPRAGRSQSFYVASVNATLREKRDADSICDGVDDDVQINAALDAVANGPYAGGVQLSSGDFTVTSPIIVPPWTTLFGMSKACSDIYVDGCDAIIAGGSAEIFDLGLYGDGTTKAIVADTSLYNSGFNPWGRVHDCNIWNWATGIETKSPFWAISDIFFTNFAVGAWPIDLPASASTWSGYNTRIIRNEFHSSQAIRADGGQNLIIGNRLSGTTGRAYGILLRVGVTGVNHTSLVAQNYIFGYATSAIRAESNNDKIKGNVVDRIEVAGDGVQLVSNDSPGAGGSTISIEATANATRLALNSGYTITDLGTGTVRNFDGSATDWNV